MAHLQVTVAHLQGSAEKWLGDLAAVHDPSIEWLRTELEAALQETALIAPLADEERERREDF